MARIAMRIETQHSEFFIEKFIALRHTASVNKGIFTYCSVNIRHELSVFKECRVKKALKVFKGLISLSSTGQI